MAITTWPLDAVSGAPAYTGRMLRTAMMGPALGGATPARPLGARSGVRPGTDVSISVTATSSTVTVGAMAGVLDVLPSALTGPYGWAITAAESGSLAAAHASYTRWDGVAIALDDPAEAAGTVPQSRIVIVTGTASSNPVMPALPARSMWLARVVVPRSGQGVPAVVDIAPRCGSADGVPHFGTVADRDAILPVPWVGQVCTTGAGSGLCVWISTGSGWSLQLGDATAWVLDSNSSYWQRNKLACRVGGGVVTIQAEYFKINGPWGSPPWSTDALISLTGPARATFDGINAYQANTSDSRFGVQVNRGSIRVANLSGANLTFGGTDWIQLSVSWIAQ